MAAKLPTITTTALTIYLAGALAGRADDAPKVNFKDNVLPILQAKCNGCHNNDKKKGGLALDTFGGAMAGGGSGSVISPGDPDNSRLFLLVNHDEEPVMPPGSPKLPDAELAAIRSWIEAGAPETSGSVVAAASKPKMEFKLDPSAIGKPQGEPAMPTGLSTEPAITSARPNAILALAASPWAPLVAVGSHKQVLLYNTQTLALAGVLPFPEGTIHCLRFSRDGGILLVAGGRAAQKGLAVAFDVKSGSRLFEVGGEYDVVLAADISPDRSLVALGGPSRVLRVFNPADGQLVYEARKHTEWVTAIAFSPDGVLLASGDRNGGLLVWEAQTGREFYDLRGHGGMITGIDWRLDSNMVASASEDGTARLWEMQNGTQVKSWGSNGGGTQSVSFAKDGRLVTNGRDRTAKLWKSDGNQERAFEAFGDIGTRAVFTHDDGAVVAGDWSGAVRVFKTADGIQAGALDANPQPLAARIEAITQALAAAQVAAEVQVKEYSALEAAAAQKSQVRTSAEQALAAAEKQVADAQAALQVAMQTQGAQKAALEAGRKDEADAGKAAGDRKPQLDAAIARAAALKGELDSLAAQKKASDAAAASAAAVTAPPPASPSP